MQSSTITEIQYYIGELVFAKCQSYKPWPAEITSICLAKSRGNKKQEYIYNVKFIGHPSRSSHRISELERFDEQTINKYRRLYEGSNNRQEKTILKNIDSGLKKQPIISLQKQKKGASQLQISKDSLKVTKTNQSKSTQTQKSKDKMQSRSKSRQKQSKQKSRSANQQPQLVTKKKKKSEWKSLSQEDLKVQNDEMRFPRRLKGIQKSKQSKARQTKHQLDRESRKVRKQLYQAQYLPQDLYNSHEPQAVPTHKRILNQQSAVANQEKDEDYYDLLDGNQREDGAEDSQIFFDQPQQEPKPQQVAQGNTQQSNLVKQFEKQVADLLKQNKKPEIPKFTSVCQQALSKIHVPYLNQNKSRLRFQTLPVENVSSANYSIQRTNEARWKGQSQKQQQCSDERFGVYQMLVNLSFDKNQQKKQRKAGLPKGQKQQGSKKSK